MLSAKCYWPVCRCGLGCSPEHSNSADLVAGTQHVLLWEHRGLCKRKVEIESYDAWLFLPALLRWFSWERKRMFCSPSSAGTVPMPWPSLCPACTAVCPGSGVKAHPPHRGHALQRTGERGPMAVAACCMLWGCCSHQWNLQRWLEPARYE